MLCGLVVGERRKVIKDKEATPFSLHCPLVSLPVGIGDKLRYDQLCEIEGREMRLTFFLPIYPPLCQKALLKKELLVRWKRIYYRSNR